MTSSRSAETILHRGKSDQTRDRGAQDISTMVKQVQQDLPACRHPDSSRTYLVSGHDRMNTTYGNRSPQVKGWHCKWLCFLTSTHEEHWPGLLIKSTGSGKSLCKF